MPTTSERSVATLEVVEGPAAGSRVELSGELVLGRAEQGPGGLGGDAQLSRRHARVQRLPDGRVMIEDLGSTNGVEVNGARIPAPTVLQPGDVVRLGATLLRLLEAGDGGAPAAPAPAGAAPAAPEIDRRLVLRVAAGAAPGAQIQLGPTPITLGSEQAALAADAAIGASHARVTPLGGGRVMLEDLGSESGTWIGDQRVAAPTVLSPGDRFQVGGTVLELAHVRGFEARRRRQPGAGLSTGGVQKVPGGLWALIAARAPVTRQQVVSVYFLALGWGLAANLLIRQFALGVLNVPNDLSALEIGKILLAAIVPTTANTIGFYTNFRRPTNVSPIRYMVPTILVPILFVIFELTTSNHHDIGSIVVTIVVTVTPICITATLMLRLRARVARERVTQTRR